MDKSLTKNSKVKVVKLSKNASDFDFWQSQPYLARLEALESIRSEYNNWKYGAEQRFHRVYKVTQFE